MADGAGSVPGFHGKLPAKGDFVTRRLPRGFVDSWDSWLQDVVAGSRARMNESWLDAYLTSPIWRFVLAPGLCGEAAMAGVLMPSVDRVGRYFPLTIAALLPATVDCVGLPAASPAWFAAAERLVRTALDDGFDFDGFDAAVMALGVPAAGDGGPALPAVGGQALRLPIADADAIDPAYRALAGRWIDAAYPRASLWWTAGSDGIEATFLVCAGLPAAERFGAFLDGRWEHWGWVDPPPLAVASA